MTREQAKLLRDDLKDYLQDFIKEHNLTLDIPRVSYDDAKALIQIELTQVDDKGQKKFSESEKYAADAAFAFAGVPLVGSAMGAKFIKDGVAYTIANYVRRGKYNFHCITNMGKRVKMSAKWFLSAEQLVQPTYEDFVVWLGIDDINDDCISPEEETTYDKVNDWLSYLYGTDAEIEQMFTEFDLKAKKVRKSAKLTKQIYTTILWDANSVTDALIKVK